MKKALKSHDRMKGCLLARNHAHINCVPFVGINLVSSVFKEFGRHFNVSYTYFVVV